MKFFLSLFFIFVFGAHDFYVSITEIDFNPEANTLEIAIKTFANDIEQAIDKEEEAMLNIGEMNEHPDCDTYLKDYFKNHLKIEVDGAPAKLEYLGREMEKRDAVWTFFEVFDIEDPKQVKITNLILVDHFKNQQNIVYFGKEEGSPFTLMFTKDKTSEIVKLAE
ncbi:MAG: DUF6702 family protein [Bacteroidota bacterium]